MNALSNGQIDSIVQLAEAIDNYGALMIGLTLFVLIALIAISFVFNRVNKMTKDRDEDFKNMRTNNQQLFKHLMDNAFQVEQKEVSKSIFPSGVVEEKLRTITTISNKKASIYSIALLMLIILMAIFILLGRRVSKR